MVILFFIQLQLCLKSKAHINTQQPLFLVVGIISIIDPKRGAERIAQLRVKSRIIGYSKEISGLDIYSQVLNFNFLYPFLWKSVAKNHRLIPEIRAIL